MIKKKLLKFEAEGQEIFEITRTIYSNSERSEQFLKQNAPLTYSWRFLRSNTLEQLKFKLDKIIWIQKPTGKVRKMRYFRSLSFDSHKGYEKRNSKFLEVKGLCLDLDKWPLAVRENGLA